MYIQIKIRKVTMAKVKFLLFIISFTSVHVSSFIASSCHGLIMLKPPSYQYVSLQSTLLCSTQKENIIQQSNRQQKGRRRNESITSYTGNDQELGDNFSNSKKENRSIKTKKKKQNNGKTRVSKEELNALVKNLGLVPVIPSKEKKNNINLFPLNDDETFLKSIQDIDIQTQLYIQPMAVRVW